MNDLSQQSAPEALMEDFAAYASTNDDTIHADVHASIKLVQAEELEFLRERIKDENREILLKNDDDVNIVDMNNSGRHYEKERETKKGGKEEPHKKKQARRRSSRRSDRSSSRTRSSHMSHFVSSSRSSSRTAHDSKSKAFSRSNSENNLSKASSSRSKTGRSGKSKNNSSHLLDTSERSSTGIGTAATKSRKSGKSRSRNNSYHLDISETSRVSDNSSNLRASMTEDFLAWGNDTSKKNEEVQDCLEQAEAEEREQLRAFIKIQNEVRM